MFFLGWYDNCLYFCLLNAKIFYNNRREKREIDDNRSNCVLIFQRITPEIFSHITIAILVGYLAFPNWSQKIFTHT